jgi:hypothetical protein
MRITTVAPQAVAQLNDPRMRARAARPASPAGSPAAPGVAGLHLPGAVADRLAVLMADDPAFAAAVNAQLPEARRASARDFAETAPVPQHPRLDLAG